VGVERVDSTKEENPTPGSTPHRCEQHAGGPTPMVLLNVPRVSHIQWAPRAHVERALCRQGQQISAVGPSVANLVQAAMHMGEVLGLAICAVRDSKRMVRHSIGPY
jgi:hypothetical protein